MDGKSLDINELKISQLREIFPEIFSENKVDFQRLKQSLGEDVFVKDEHYELSWAGKSEARKEIQKQTTATLIPDREYSIDFDRAENIFIEGENLEVLRLLQKSYFAKVKMIYIDPPYNTGNDSFVYPDDYTERKEEYNKRTGIANNEGFLNKQDLWKKNTKENGQFHSVWLSMMYPRLYLSRNLLTEDGLIFMSIDDNEVSNLKLLCDEIFGEQNFIGKFIWINRTTPNDPGKGFATDHEYIIIYSKNIESANFKGYDKDLSNYKNPDNDPKGDWIADNPTAASGNDNYKFPIINPFTNEKYFPPRGRFWAFSPKRVSEWFENGKLVFPTIEGKNFILKKYKSELKSNLKPISSIIQGILTSKGTKELKALFEDASPFKYPKPTALLKLLIAQITEDNDIILDFFAGSGTTAHAVIDLNREQNTNRKFICVQMPEIYNSEDGALNEKYKFVSDVTKLRITKAIKNHTNKNVDLNSASLKFKCFNLAPTQFKIWQQNITGAKEIQRQLAIFKEASHYDSDESLLYELIIKSGIALTAEIREYNDVFKFFVVDHKLAFIFKEMSLDLVSYLINEIKPQMIFCLDKAFNNNDKLKTNISLQLNEHSISLKTI
jgi:adenine-specific DNA-methyltransferase